MRQPTPDILAQAGQSSDDVMMAMGPMESNPLAPLSLVSMRLAEANTVAEVKSIIDVCDAAKFYAKKANLNFELQNTAAEHALLARYRCGELLAQLEDNPVGRPKLSNVGQFSQKQAVLDETGTTRQDASRWQKLAQLPKETLHGWLEQQWQAREEITTTSALRFGKKLDRDTEPEPEPAPLAARQPRLIVGLAEDLAEIEDGSVNVIITSPPYNLGSNHWDMGHRGSRDAGIGYDDAMPEQEYREWQKAVIMELYRVAAPGASLFYNHKVRIKNGQASLPSDWVRGMGWTLRQVIIWDRTSTHNHEPRLFWPHDEWVLWLTKGKPDLRHPINMPSVWRFHGPTPNTWHPAPFSEELPQHCLQAVGFPGCVVLDPFAGSCTTIKVALEMGYDAIGVDVSAEYLRRAAAENGWRFEQ